jgi:hypothetical protein
VVDLGENALGGQGEHEAGLNSGASVTYSGLLYARGFDMYMRTWSQEITGPGADLVRADIIHHRGRNPGGEEEGHGAPCLSRRAGAALRTGAAA